MTAPYGSVMSELIKHSIEHYAELTVHPRGGAPSFVLPLEGDDMTITFSEDWSPYVQLTAGTAIPAAAAQLAALDPRLRCRVRVRAGYIYPDRTEDVHQLADLALIKRDDSAPANQLLLLAGSDEYLAQGFAKMWPEFNAPTTSLADAVEWLAGHSVAPSVPVVTSDFPAGMGSYLLRDMETPIGEPFWDIMADAAQRCSAWVYCDEQRIWRVAKKAGLAEFADLAVTDGKDGTLITSEDTLDRDGWANAVLIKYEWRDAAGADQIIYGRAIAQDGPYALDAVGRKLHQETRRLNVTQDQADAAAAGLLRNLISRGRGVTFEAHAAYWLRPGMTASVRRRAGTAESYLVKSVAFEPGRGLMRVETRSPLDFTITTGDL